MLLLHNRQLPVREPMLPDSLCYANCFVLFLTDSQLIEVGRRYADPQEMNSALPRIYKLRDPTQDKNVNL